MDRNQILAIYEQVIDSIDTIDLKGKTMPYTSANGHMFSLINKDNELGIRLSKEMGDDFIQKYDSGEFRSHGAVMRGYVRIPDQVLEDPQVLAEYLIKGHKYVMTLPPK